MCRVSSASTKSADLRVSMARNVMSARFPIGVATTYSFFTKVVYWLYYLMATC